MTEQVKQLDSPHGVIEQMQLSMSPAIRGLLLFVATSAMSCVQKTEPATHIAVEENADEAPVCYDDKSAQYFGSKSSKASPSHLDGKYEECLTAKPSASYLTAKPSKVEYYDFDKGLPTCPQG